MYNFLNKIKIKLQMTKLLHTIIKNNSYDHKKTIAYDK